MTLGDAGAKMGHHDARTREPVAVAISLRCDGCITLHTAAAKKLGASRGEIAEALSSGSASMPALRSCTQPERLTHSRQRLKEPSAENGRASSLHLTGEFETEAEDDNPLAESIAITGDASQICYSLLFRLAHGEVFGPDQPVILQLLDLPQVLPNVRGVLMELEDCAFPQLAGVVVTDDPVTAFRDIDAAMLVGSRPRSKGMERRDLLAANAEIFGPERSGPNVMRTSWWSAIPPTPTPRS